MFNPWIPGYFVARVPIVELIDNYLDVIITDEGIGEDFAMATLIVDELIEDLMDGPN